MNIFEQYLDKIKEILSTLSSNGDLILPDSLNGITAEIPPSKFDSDISTNVAMVLSKINNKSPLDLASILAEKIKKEDKFIEDISVVKPGFINIKFINICLLKFIAFFNQCFKEQLVFFCKQPHIFNQMIVISNKFWIFD